jgi:hypothetical protein
MFSAKDLRTTKRIWLIESKELLQKKKNQNVLLRNCGSELCINNFKK